MKIIVTDRETEKTLSFAGEELERYLTAMTAGEEGVFSVSLAVEGEEETDAFRVELDEGGGTVTGSNRRSVLLAVYDYLHRLGCRFLSPVKETEVIPAVSRGDLPARYEKRASFRHRGVCIEGATSAENVLDFIDWLPKVGYNSFFLQFKVPYAFLARWYHHEKNPCREREGYTMEDAALHMARFEEEMDRRGLLLHKAGHGWTGEVLGGGAVGSWDESAAAIPPEKRPFAAEIGGKRDFFMGIPANTNLCLSNPATVDAFAALVVDYARANPGVDCLHVWLADEYNNVCECPSCARATVSDHYVDLLNEIDRRLTAEGLDTRLVFLLYQELLWPPVSRRLANPDRFLLMFAPISRTFERSYELSDASCPIPEYVRNRITLPTSLDENLAFLRGWQRQFPGEGFVYDYPLGRAHYGDFGYLHISRVISEDIKKLRLMGLDGYISCQELRAACPNMLPNYVMGYTLFDETAPVEELVEEYCRAAYPGAPELARRYLEQLSALSCCDYVNGKGPRTDGDMAERMERIAALCRETAPRLAELTGPWWEVLRHHNGYILRFAGALAALAGGREEESGRLYREMRRYICEGEAEFQPYLDVYRVMEVTQKYTGFAHLV